MTGIKAAVFLKQVPFGVRPIRIDHGAVRRDLTVLGIDPINEVPLEWALRAREAGRLERVIAITMGPPAAVDVLRKACAMGADEAIHVCDSALDGADVRLTAEVLSATTRRCSASLALFGYESADGSSGIVPAAVAARLDWPLLSRMSQARLSEDGAALSGESDIGHGPERVHGPVPTVVSFVDGRVVPRFPKVKEMLRVRRIEFPTVGLPELGLTMDLAGAEQIVSVFQMPFSPKQPKVYGREDGGRVLRDLLETAVKGTP